MSGTLYIVSTPIGNLKDITLRAIETLRSVDLIACEDTRHTAKLLNHLRISNRTISYHEHNEQERAEELCERLLTGESIAVVSDAGTPGISDPGFHIVQRAIEAGVTVVPVPGAAAFVTAVSASGLPTDAMFYGGFLPARKGDRKKRLEEIRDIPATIVVYESPRRLEKSLADCLEILGPRRAVIARELTKLHEEFDRGTLTELAAKYKDRSVKGEIVLVIDRVRKDQRPPNAGTKDVLLGRVVQLEKEGKDPMAAIKLAAKELGISKSEAYRNLKIKK